MTVGELAEILQCFPGGPRVVVNGCEEGCDDLAPKQITRIRIGLDTGKHNWEGVHGHPDDARKSADIVEAVVSQRTSQ